MRLMHLIHTPRHSGAEILVLDLCRLHRAWGHDCAIASFAPPRAEFSDCVDELQQIGVISYYPEAPKTKLARIAHYHAAINRFKPDIVFAHSELPSLYGRFATGAGTSRTRFVSVMHSENDFSETALAWAERLTRFRVDHIVAVSDRAATNHQSRFGMRVPVSVIPNGIDIDRFAFVDRQASRAELDVAASAVLVLQVGRIADLKQQSLTLRVLTPWLKSGEASLWFAGLTEDPAYEGALRRTVEEFGLKSSVRFLGSRSDVPKLLAAADLYMMPSKVESQGIAMLEALASGIPIVASEIPAFEFAKTLPGVRLCPLSEDSKWRAAIAEIMKTSRFSRRLEGHSIEKTANSYLSLHNFANSSAKP